MPKTKIRAAKTPAIERELMKWSCTLFGDKSEIDVFVESAGRWETAAEIRSVGKYDAEEVANFIASRLSQGECMDVRKEAAKPPLTIRDD